MLLLKKQAELTNHKKENLKLKCGKAVTQTVWLGNQDSNLAYMIQSHVSYR